MKNLLVITLLFLVGCAEYSSYEECVNTLYTEIWLEQMDDAMSGRKSRYSDRALEWEKAKIRVYCDQFGSRF